LMVKGCGKHVQPVFSHDCLATGPSIGLVWEEGSN
jgi:hypothetical protein